MSKTYHLSIVTPEKLAFDDEVHSLIAPGSYGYLQILVDHAAIITSLNPGKLTITDKENKKLIFAIAGGLLEMFHNEATLLADSIEAASEIDYERAEAAYKRARQRLESHDKTIDKVRAQKALHRAENRKKIYMQEVVTTENY